MERKPGDKFGPYEIVSAIGKGGMGEVWKARGTATFPALTSALFPATNLVLFRIG